MKSCVVQGPFRKVTCKEYNRKYTTPPIFNEYKINWILCLVNLVASIVMTFALQNYQLFYCIELGLAATYLFNVLIVREMYRSGCFNTSVVYGTGSYIVSKFIAGMSQGSVIRLLIPTIFYLYNGTISKVLLANFIVSIVCFAVLSVVSVFVMTGVLEDTKYYIHSAQKMYRALLDGQDDYHTNIDAFMKSSLDFKLLKLERPECATDAYFKAQEQFVYSAEQIRSMLEHYDENWRKAILFGGYQTMENAVIPNTDGRLVALCKKHRQNAEQLNAIILDLNKQSDPARAKAPFAARNTKEYHNSKPKEFKQSVEQLWGTTVNWYK